MGQPAIPNDVLVRSTHAAWQCTQRALPHLLALHEEPHWNPTTGSGLCAHGAAWLHLLLEQHGKTPSIAMVQGHIVAHCFVLCDGFRLDPTAMQFGTPEPLVEWNTDDAPWYYRKPALYPSIGALCAKLEQLGWYDAQIPGYLLSVDRVISNSDHDSQQNM